MKTINNVSKFALMIAAFSFIMISCQKDDLNMGKNDKSKGSPVELGGNLECVDSDFSTGRINYDPETNSFDGVWPEGLTVTVTEGKYISFELVQPFQVDGVCYLVGSVIVKGGPAAERYTFAEGSAGASALASPANRGGNVPDLSNLTFCFIAVECPVADCKWEEETAYAGNTGFNVYSSGAWWYAFDTANGSPQDIYAGQKKVEGASVSYAGGVISIVLGDNMRLQDGDETVKILGYDELPDSRPASGGGPSSPRIYAGTLLSVPVADFAYYVIHIDVEVLYCE
jgi:hypothetical protein